uniref:Bm692 n=1 Tax=Brugia malayi TaxID=6279 RepID=A0A0H5SQC8_BRUMA|nr:Bm692 [Brugia malayi]
MSSKTKLLKDFAPFCAGKIKLDINSRLSWPQQEFFVQSQV